MKWYHNGIKYKTIKVDWKEYNNKEKNLQEDKVIVFNTNWNKCYYLKGLYEQGGSIKANICDIYKPNGSDIWCDSKELEIVVEDK